MSTGFDILFSPAPESSGQPIEVYKKLLCVILDSPNIRSDACDLTIYRGQLPFNYGSDSDDPSIVYQLPANAAITPQEVFRVIDSLKIDDLYVEVCLAYERLEWNNEICDAEPSAGSLSVEYESPTFGAGYRTRQLGPYRVHFDNLKYFSYDAIDLSKCPADSPAALLKIAQYGENAVLVKNLFKRIAAAIKPKHQFLITEGNRVNPLLFHMVYHNSPSGYLFDVQKIIQLHNYGGGYFYEGRERAVDPDDTRDFDPPYSMLNAECTRYGDSIRTIEEAEELERKLDSYGRLFDGMSLEGWSVNEEDVLTAMALANVEPETLNGGLCASSPRFLWGYLDRFYLKLLETIIAPIESSVSRPS